MATLADPSAKTPVRTQGRIFVVEDHPIYRLGLTRLIDAEEDLKVCGYASSAAHALEALRNTAADIVIVDISLPRTNGLELVKHLRAEHPKVPLLVLSAHDERIYAMRCLRAGASGYLMKSSADEALTTALRKILEGGVAVSEKLGVQFIDKMAHRPSDPEMELLDKLSDRELEILQLVGSGKSTQEVADLLHLSVKTVESHRLHLKEKLGLPDAPSLLRYAVQWVKEHILEVPERADG